LADDFKYVTSNGKVVTKTEFLAKLKTLKYDTVTFEDVKVTALGSTAVAIGVYMARGTDASGRSFDFRERAVDTWVKMPDGQWKCVASVGTPLKM
jgi:ketosteroid isomerase-like protein